MRAWLSRLFSSRDAPIDALFRRTTEALDADDFESALASSSELCALLEKKSADPRDRVPALFAHASACLRLERIEEGRVSIDRALVLAEGVAKRTEPDANALRALRGRLELCALEKRYRAAAHEDTPTTRAELALLADLAETRATASRDPDDARALEGLASAANHTLGARLADTGETADAIRFLERSLTARRKLVTPDDPTLRPTLTRLGAIHAAEDRILLALALYDEALRIARKELGEDSPPVVALIAARRELL